MKIKFSETFRSFQGEGEHTGKCSVWIRLWGCPLNCHGFSQPDPRDPSTYILDFKEFDAKSANIDRVEDLPVWKTGCDSSYTWSEKYNFLAKQGSAKAVATELKKLVPNDAWVNDFQDTHLCITGGEPFMQQMQIIALVDEFIQSGDYPINITFETNGTLRLKTEFVKAIKRWQSLEKPITVFFSTSPKLWGVSGEKPDKAIKPNVIAEYSSLSHGQLKFVVNTDPQTWVELDEAINAFREAGVDYPVWIMPCGSTFEEQDRDGYMKEISDKALARGWNVSARVHTWVYGNAVGT